MAHKRLLKWVDVKDIEKRYRPVRCYKFVLEVLWSDSTHYVIYRSFSEFFTLHLQLLDAFPIEAGVISHKDRVLPSLAGPSSFQRNNVYKVAERRKAEIAKYCAELVALDAKILKFPFTLEFFELRDDDIEVPPDTKVKRSILRTLGEKLFSRKKRSLRRRPSEIEITDPFLPESYVAVASYKATGKGQISFNKGDHIDVIDKNSNGWWYVTYAGGSGWAPATYLDNVKSDSSEPDEMLCMEGEMYLAIKSYTAQFDDEISFEERAVLEVMNKVLDGWWVASFNGRVGYIPSTYVKSYNNPHLLNTKKVITTFISERSNDLVQTPVPRRRSIKEIVQRQQRDLVPYRVASQKRRMRSVKLMRVKTQGSIKSAQISLQTNTAVDPSCSSPIADSEENQISSGSSGYLESLVEDDEETQQDCEPYQLSDTCLFEAFADTIDVQAAVIQKMDPEENIPELAASNEIVFVVPTSTKSDSTGFESQQDVSLDDSLISQNPDTFCKLSGDIGSSIQSNHDNQSNPSSCNLASGTQSLGTLACDLSLPDSFLNSQKQQTNEGNKCLGENDSPALENTAARMNAPPALPPGASFTLLVRNVETGDYEYVPLFEKDSKTYCAENVTVHQTTLENMAGVGPTLKRYGARKVQFCEQIATYAIEDGTTNVTTDSLRARSSSLNCEQVGCEEDTPADPKTGSITRSSNSIVYERCQGQGSKTTPIVPQTEPTRTSLTGPDSFTEQFMNGDNNRESSVLNVNDNDFSKKFEDNVDDTSRLKRKRVGFIMPMDG